MQVVLKRNEHEKIRVAIKNSAQTCDTFHPRMKPKGMRRSTYERHLDKLDHLNAAMDLALIQRFGMTAEVILNNARNFDRKEE